VPRLSSGLVIAGAYATKVRRTLFAQLRDRTKADKEWAQKVAFASAQLNRIQRGRLSPTAAAPRELLQVKVRLYHAADAYASHNYQHQYEA